MDTKRPRAIVAAQAALCIYVGIKMTDAFYTAATNSAADFSSRILDGVLIAPAVTIGTVGLYSLVKAVTNNDWKL